MEWAGLYSGAMYRCLFLGLLPVVCAVSAVALDSLERPAGPPVEGFFLSYDRGTFNFMNKEQKTLHERPSAVKKLTMEKPVRATVELKTKRNEKQEVEIVGYEAGQFLVLRDGAPEKIALMNVAELAAKSIDMNRTTDQLGSQDYVISKGEEVDLAKAAVPGKVTILQFHLPGSISSERQGNSVMTMAKESKGKIEVKRVIVPSPQAPVARQQALTSLPQFWFYGKSGQLVTKLTDRFTDQDIVDAVKKAAK